MPIDKNDHFDKIRIRQLEEGLKEDCQQSLKERIERYVSVERLPMTPYTHFAPVSAECLLLYRDGYFFACICLCQSVAEALSKFLCQKSKIRNKGVHETRVNRLVREHAISPDTKDSFDKIHSNRDDFHHFSPQVPSDRKILGRIAYEALTELSKIERQVFAFSIKEGKLVPKHPEFWP